MSSKILTCWGDCPAELMERLKALKLVAFDVDGTLTDGGVYLDNEKGELKKFFTKDGLGISQLLRGGVECAVITGRSSEIVARRMRELKVTRVYQGVSDKSAVLRALREELKLTKAQCAAMGDDLNDLPMFAEAGFTACPGDAHPYIKSVSDLVLTMPGGRGAARELTDLILMAQDKLDAQGGPR